VELQTLRRFRDEYVAHQPNGYADIQEYYDTAPRVLQRILVSPKSTEYLADIYRIMVLPTVEFVKNRQYDFAYAHYKIQMRTLSSVWLD